VVLRDIHAFRFECQEDIDIHEAFKFLRWSGARWGACKENGKKEKVDVKK
jgi:hypothetical protein